MPWGDEIDELLSGYMDDQLSADERLRVETAMRDDRGLGDRLEGLRELSRSLQLAGSQPRKGLSSDFTARVLTRCSQVSASSADQAGIEPLLSSSPAKPVDKRPCSPEPVPQGSSKQAKQRKRLQKRMTIAAAALAGMVLFATVLPQWLTKEEPIRPLADSSIASNGVALDSQQKHDVEIPKGLEQSQSHVNSLALGTDASGNRNQRVTPAFPGNDVSEEMLKPGDSNPARHGANIPASSDLASGDLAQDLLGRMASDHPGGAAISYLLVLDLEISPVAAEHKLLEGLFAKYGIDMAVGVPMSGEIEKAVNRMRYTVREGQTSRPAELFLVRAPSAILDAAVGELESEVDLIPGYRFDLAFQTPSVSLSQAIADAMDDSSILVDRIAVPVVTSVAESAPRASVEAIPHQGTLISANRRQERYDTASPNLPMGGDSGYLLILVRLQQ